MSSSMKTFTAQAISQRIKRRWLSKLNLRESVDDTAVDSLIQATAEEFAEAMRYDEYLTRERSWEHMRNLSSVVSDARFVGYEPKRKRSAIATLMFTIDSNIQKLGRYSEQVHIENIDPVSGELIDVSIEPGIVDYNNLQSLRHINNGPSTVVIPRGTIVEDADSGLTFMTTDQATIQIISGLSLEEDANVTRTSTSRWAKVAAIQGRRREVRTYNVTGREFERVNISSNKVEQMDSAVADSAPSIAGLSVEVLVPGSTTWTKWSMVQDLREASPYQRVFTLQTALDYSSVDIVFGNGVSGRKVPAGSDIRVQYLETEGASGNIPASHKLTTIRSPLEIPANIDAIYVTNVNPVVNGSDEDSIEDIKANAPRHYLTVDTIGSTEAYEAIIEAQPNVRTAKVFRGTYKSNQPGVERATVSFTALTQDGVAPPDTFADVIRAVVGRRAGPTDILQYEAPEQVKITYNIQGYVNDVSRDLQFFINEIRRTMYNSFSINNLTFKQPIYHIDVMTLLRMRFEALIQARVFPEALLTRSFYQNQFATNEAGVDLMDFRFNESLAPFRTEMHNVRHILRVDFIFEPPALEHRSRTALVIPDGEGSYIVRQFRLLGDIVLTPERVGNMIAAPEEYDVKSETTWHWINKIELEEIESSDTENIGYNRAGSSITPSLALQTALALELSSRWRLLIDWDSEGSEVDAVYLLYTHVVDIESLPEEAARDYANAYENWASTDWATDPDVVIQNPEEAEYPFNHFGPIPLSFAPDRTHAAPIEITFNPYDVGGAQTGAGTIAINSVAAGQRINFIPDDSYSADPEGNICAIHIFAQPRELDLRLDRDISIFQLDPEFIRIDLSYRTEFESEFQIAYEYQPIEEENS